MTEQPENTTGAKEQERLATQKQGRMRVLGILAVLLVVGIPFLWYFVPSVQEPLTYLAILLGVVGLFPVSYLTYRAFGEPVRRQRLKDDFRLLGLVDEDELDETVEKLYRDTYNPLQFVAYIALILLVSLTMILVYRYRSGVGVVDAATLASMFYAFLGAYVFGVQQLVRRYSTMDIQPQLYSAILTRMIVAVGLVFVAATVITASGGEIAAGDPAQAAGWAAVLAFLIGLFPSEGLRWISKKMALVFTSTPFDRANELPLRALLGVSAWHEARLNELGVDDAQNLATVDLRKLLLTTQFDTQQIVHWVDQAILHCKVGSKIERYREVGIVTFHDLRGVLVGMPSDVDRQDHLQNLVTLLGGSDAGDLEHLGDYSNYPNYAYLLEYYTRSRRVARARAEEGEENVLGVVQENQDEDGYLRQVQYWQRLLTRNEQDAEAWINLADVCHGLSMVIKDEQNAARYRQDAQEFVRRALEIAPNLAYGYYLRSLMSLEEGALEETVRDATEALRLSEDRQVRLMALHNRGLAYSQMHYFDLALKDFDRVLTEDVRRGATYKARGVTLNALSRFEQAVNDCWAAYLLGEHDRNLWVVWGSALIGLDRFEEAVEKLSRAVQMEVDAPADNALVYGRRGYAYMQRGAEFYAQARADLLNSVNLDANFEAYVNLGVLEARNANWQQAVDYYQKALELSNYWLTWFYLARAYEKLGQADEAMKAYQKVLELAPVDVPEYREAEQILARNSAESQNPVP
ncbi:MAG: tetratricopeptide repeat protein [Longilinea sp.]|nr:tetratricopeptide repeat protein [Longilinea sp.]MCA1953959.1 tetratricopeptide repeat protein [Anaerolinea sp.]